MHKIVMFFFVTGLCGCATVAKYDARLNSYVGVSEDALISAWGIPQKEYVTSSGKKALEFVRERDIAMGGYSYSTPVTTRTTGRYDGKAYTEESTTYVSHTEPVYNVRASCRTTFILGADGTVESWSHHGDDCVAR